MKTSFAKKSQDGFKKPRVYFACHPDDFSEYYKIISNDILGMYDCTIYYAESIDNEIKEQYKDGYLSDANLVVIPITRKLLENPNRMIDWDLHCAKKATIPILPIVVEPHLDKLYSKNLATFTI